MTTSNRWYLGEIVFDDGSEPRLMEGIPLVREGTLRAAVTHPGPRLDFFLTSFGIPITTRQLAQEIGAVAGSDLQRRALHDSDFELLCRGREFAQ